MNDNTAAPTGTLRRVPRQQRSRDRLDAILDSAAKLLAAEGPDGTTITSVADSAGLATSSVYDYVEGDRELIGAVAERGLERIHLSLVEMIGEPASLDALLASLSDGLRLFLDLYQSEPGFKEALAFIDADPILMEINLADTRRNAGVIAAALRPFRPESDVDSATLLITHLSGALANLAARVDRDEALRLVSEFERMLAFVLGANQPSY